jgi:hypothetical protein
MRYQAQAARPPAAHSALAYTTQRRTPHGTHGVGVQGATLHARSAGQVPVHARRRHMREDVCTSMNGACDKTAPSRGQCVRRSTENEQRYAHKWQWRQNGARRRRAQRRLQSASGGGPFMEADKYLVEAMVVVATEKADEHRLVCRPADHASRCTFRTRRRLGGFSLAVNELSGFSSALTPQL